MSKSQNNTPVLFEVIAIKDCQKKQPDFLTFPIGEKISVLKNKGDTWLGFSKKKGIKHSGYFSRHNVFQISKSEKQYLTVDESTSETGQYTSESVSTKKFSYDFSSSTDTEIDYEDLFYSKNESIMSDDEHSEDLGKLLKSLNGNKKKFESLIKTDVNKTSYFPKDVVYDTKKKKRKKKKKKMKTKKKSNREEKKKPKVKKKTKTKNSYKDNSDSDFNKPNNKHNMKKNENINITNQNSKENNKHFHSSSNKNSNPPKGNETDNDSGDPNDSENINEVMTNSANDGVQIKFKDLKPPPKPKGKKPKLITKSLNEKISLKNKYSGEIHINSNFTWAINKKKKKKKIRLEKFESSTKNLFFILGKTSQDNIKILRSSKDFKKLRLLLLQYQPLSIPNIGPKNKSMGKMDVLSAFLQKVISHPILWHTQYVQSFLDLDKTDWGEVIKSIKKAKPNLNFLEKITVDFKYRDMMPEYKKSLIYFNNYLNNVETQLKDLQSSWSNNLHSEMVYKKNLQKYSNSIENISKNGLEWREPNSFEFQNGNKSTENTRSSLTGLCQSFSTILDSLEKTNKNITHNLSHNLNDIFTEISGFKQLFKRMEHLQKRVDAHYQNHLKSIHTSNYNTVKLEKKMMKENKKQLDVFRLSMLAESELFRESLLNNINSSMVDFLQNQLNFHKNSVNTYQSALDSFNSIQVEKGSSYCEMQK